MTQALPPLTEPPLTQIAFMLNGAACTVTVPPATSVLMVLRQDLGLTGTRLGCNAGQCGACTALVDGRPVGTCDLPIEAISGCRLTTIEAASDHTVLGMVRQAFLDEQAAQCGYCINGFIMRIAGLIDRNPPLSRPEIVAELDHRNLCRCGAHPRILRALERAISAIERGSP